MEEGAAADPSKPEAMSHVNSISTFDETATASSLDQDGSSLGGNDAAGEAFEKRSHILFPGHAEFDGLDPLSI
jgi:hypothetical protein